MKIHQVFCAATPINSANNSTLPDTRPDSVESQPDGLIGTDSNIIHTDEIALVKWTVTALLQHLPNQLQRTWPCGIFVRIISRTAKHNGIHWQTFWKVLDCFLRCRSCKLKHVRNARVLMAVQNVWEIEIFQNWRCNGNRKIHRHQAATDINGSGHR